MEVHWDFERPVVGVRQRHVENNIGISGPSIPDLAALLEADGLPKGHRKIQLVQCFAQV